MTVHLINILFLILLHVAAVVEAFFLNDEEKYLEVELCP